MNPHLNQRSPIASAYPLVLYAATAIIFFTVGFAPSIMLFFGGLICWWCSYSLLTCIIYSRGYKRILLPLIQSLITYAGYFLLTKANFKLILFGFIIENYEFAYFTFTMGILMALATKPTLDEIDFVQSKGS